MVFKKIITVLLITTSNIFAFQKPPQRITLAGFQPYHLKTPHDGKTVLPKCPDDDPLCILPEPPNPIPKPPKFIVPGVLLGVPLNLLTYLSAIHQHSEYIVTPQIVLLNCLIGTYTYGMDRMMDAIEYQRIHLDISENSRELTNPSKTELYQYILENYDILKNIYDSIYWIFAMIMISDISEGVRFQTLIFIILYEFFKFSTNLRYTFFSYYLGIHGYRLYMIYAFMLACMVNSHWFDKEFLFLPFLVAIDTARYYPELKRNVGWLKAPYVAAMWTIAITILPNYIYNHITSNTYTNTIIPYNEILISFLGMMGLSNLADLKDIEEDNKNGIQTIPVKFGNPIAILLSMISLFGSGWIFTHS